MKPIKSKTDVRRELEQEVENYLSGGGEVNVIPTGLSGNESNKNVFGQQNHFEPKKERTSLHEVVKELDSRKASKKSVVKQKGSGPRKKLITDDFGEPVRWVWEDNK